MDRYRRNLVMDIFDYNKRRICNLYDSSFNVSGQATNVFVTEDRNGWKELNFMLPSVCMTENGEEDNYRLSYLKADYLIRMIDDKGIDWFIISEPRITHQAFSRNLSVTAGHNSQLLKTKNLGLEFSDEEGNNVGTAAELLTTILKGTGWRAGVVEEFEEEYGSGIKRRSLKASAKTGAFKLITEMCKLFDAKPIFHGDEKTVDIVHMNPFSEPKDGGLPDVSKADGVLELHYGQNVSNITRTLNTENLVTKLYAYGAYGDKTSGYCAIDECEHNEFIYVTTEALAAGVPYVFVPEGFSSRIVTPVVDIPAGKDLVWSMLDNASMSYMWDGSTAHPVTTGNLTYYVDQNGNQLLLPDFTDLSMNQMLPAEATSEKKQNWFSFLLDFSYYQKVGLFTDEMLQKLAEYQRNGASAYKASFDAMESYLAALSDLVEIIGSVDFLKLNVTEFTEQEGYAKLILNDEQVAYRTDYSAQERKRFEWHAAKQINDKGDPINDVASVIYVIHNTDPVTWDKVYIKAFNDT